MNINEKTLKFEACFQSFELQVHHDTHVITGCPYKVVVLYEAEWLSIEHRGGELATNKSSDRL